MCSQLLLGIIGDEKKRVVCIDVAGVETLSMIHTPFHIYFSNTIHQWLARRIAVSLFYFILSHRLFHKRLFRKSCWGQEFVLQKFVEVEVRLSKS